MVLITQLEDLDGHESNIEWSTYDIGYPNQNINTVNTGVIASICCCGYKSCAYTEGIHHQEIYYASCREADMIFIDDTDEDDDYDYDYHYD